MTDKALISNGTVKIGLKELLTVFGLVSTFAFSWAILKAKTSELEKTDTVIEAKVDKVESVGREERAGLRTIINGDHDTLKQVQSDVEHVRDDVMAIKVEQLKSREGMQRQEVNTAQILTEIKLLNEKKRR